MRYNLLRHTNKSVATLCQTSLGISCNKGGSQGFKFNISGVCSLSGALLKVSEQIRSLPVT